MSRFLLLVILCAAFLTSACGKVQPQQSAFFSREQVMEQHADYAQLQEGRQKYAKLLDKQKIYQERFRVQLACLQDLQQLEALSRADYLEADIRTRMAEYRAREEYALDGYQKVLAQRVEAQYEPSRAALEARAKNELFNLRLKLQVMRLTPEQRALLEEEYKTTRGDREQELETWKQGRKNYYQQELSIYNQAKEQRIVDQERQLYSRMEAAPIRAMDFAGQLAAAPAYIQKIFIALDDELLEQQQANNTLAQGINQDIEAAVTEVLQAKSYTEVLEDPAEKGRSVDITLEVIQKLQNKKNK